MFHPGKGLFWVACLVRRERERRAKKTKHKRDALRVLKQKNTSTLWKKKENGVALDSEKVVSVFFPSSSEALRDSMWRQLSRLDTLYPPSSISWKSLNYLCFRLRIESCLLFVSIVRHRDFLIWEGIYVRIDPDKRGSRTMDSKRHATRRCWRGERLRYPPTKARRSCRRGPGSSH